MKIIFTYRYSNSSFKMNELKEIEYGDGDVIILTKYYKY